MTKEDADRVQKIFDRSEDPQFTILSKLELSGDGVMLELIADSYLIIWYLAKNVELENQFNKRIKEITDAAAERVRQQSEEISNKLKALKK